MRAAKSAALNVAEAAGRVSRADRARVFGIARGEAMEAAAAVEIAAIAGDARPGSFEACLPRTLLYKLAPPDEGSPRKSRLNDSRCARRSLGEEDAM